MINISTETAVGAKLRQLLARLSADARRHLHSVAGTAVQEAARTHLLRYARSHHKTAYRLGARPTGVLSRAASAVGMQATPAAAEISIAAPGIARALRPLHIRPKRRKALTIPIAADSYGRKVDELRAKYRIFRVGRILIGKHHGEGDAAPTPLYALSRGVTIPMEPGLLPAQEEITRAAKSGYAAALRRILAAAGMGDSLK